MESLTDTTVEIDLNEKTVRELNAALHAPTAKSYKVSNPRGAHSAATGIKHDIDVEIDGDVGYYYAGMHQKGNVTVSGMAARGVGQTMMSGKITVRGDSTR